MKKVVQLVQGLSHSEMLAVTDDGKVYQYHHGGKLLVSPDRTKTYRLGSSVWIELEAPFRTAAEAYSEFGIETPSA